MAEDKKIKIKTDDMLANEGETGKIANEDDSEKLTNEDDILKIDEVSLFVLTTENPFRKTVMRIIMHNSFKTFILLSIITNSIMFAIPDYTHVDSAGNLMTTGSMRNTATDFADYVFISIFTVEFVCQVIALGFYSYIMDPWHVLDFVVVFAGLISFGPDLGASGSCVRTFRIFRPLKAVSAFPGLQAMVIAIIKSIPQLITVLIVLTFIFFLYGIGGLILFCGPEMHSRCRLTPYPGDSNSNIKLFNSK